MVIWKLIPNVFLDFFNSWGHYLLWYSARPLGEIDAIKDIIAPIGLSFTTFRAVDLLIKTQIGLIDRQSILNILSFGFFPPILIVGPVAELTEFTKDFEKGKKFSFKELTDGLGLVLKGLIKIYIFAYPLSDSIQIFTVFDTNPTSILWLELIMFTWYFYLNFAGFSDIAVGVSRMFGVSIMGNFNYPFFKPNPQMFWASWHMSLTRFAQRNVFIPAGGFRQRTQYLALIATMMVIAMWHDFSIPMFIFGCYHSIGLCANRFWEKHNKRPRQKVEKDPILFFKILGTYLFVMISFPLIVVPLPVLGSFYLSLIGLR